MNPKEIFEFLQGKWEINREICHCKERIDDAIQLSTNDCHVAMLVAMTITVSRKQAR